MADFTSPPMSVDGGPAYPRPTPVISGAPRLKSQSGKRHEPPPSPIPSKSPAKARTARRLNGQPTVVAAPVPPLAQFHRSYSTLKIIHSNEFSSVEEAQSSDGNHVVVVKRIRGSEHKKPREFAIMKMIKDHHATLAARQKPIDSKCLTYDYFWYQDNHHCLELPKYDMSLKQLVADGQVLCEEARWFVAKCLLEALAELKQLRIIHMDVKPDNVLLDRQRGLVLCDFGISIQQGEQPSQDGDGLYLAPEVLTNKDAVSPAVDMFSLGITLLDASTRYVIRDFRDDLRKGIIPDQLVEDMSLNWCNLLRQLVALDPMQRPDPRWLLEQNPMLMLASDDQLQQDLHDWHIRPTTHTPPPSALPREAGAFHLPPSSASRSRTLTAATAPHRRYCPRQEDELSRSLPSRIQLFQNPALRDVDLSMSGSPPSTLNATTRLDFGGDAMDDADDDLQDEFSPRNLSQMMDDSFHNDA
eukprot:TRINITY_DN8166_c0_g2_i2.p1 TRINITY_DN8166_c0_g2~~TRINITY_DN8166_c0_g2_i2.p1  ORF type:complete len:471 (+),score=103.88 TRINITY_DN8166_c0_g2_i2:463-1875(+)